MKNLYPTTANLDKRAISKYNLTSELLMENAASALAALIERITHKMSVICIVCGSGDNGADGYALARKLHKAYRVQIYVAKEPRSELCKLQSERAELCGVEHIKKISPCDVIVDCLFGSGFSGTLNTEFETLILQMNKNGRIRVACDIPSGLDGSGNIEAVAFCAHYTLSMGALKTALYSDSAKDVIGEVVVGDLGISRGLYEVHTPFFLLEREDLVLPKRTSQNCHKGKFGHLVVVAGEKQGAAFLAALSGLRIGAGLVSIMSAQSVLESSTLDSDKIDSSTTKTPFVCDIDSVLSYALGVFPEIMYAHTIPHNANVFVVGMGLGTNKIPLHKIWQSHYMVLDADILYQQEVVAALADSTLASRVVLTPHPKEFAALFGLCGLGEVSIAEVQAQRFDLALRFSEAYPESVLLLKGANTIIAHKKQLYVNSLGSSALAKGGSGDVLAGLIGGYLAQGFSPLEAAKNASLAHALAAQAEKNNYALTPQRLIEHIGAL